MARSDLDALREIIVGMGELTDSEARLIKFWGEDRLREIADMISVIVEQQEIDYPDYEPIPVPDTVILGREDYDDIADYDDDFGIWEVEITFDYGDD